MERNSFPPLHQILLCSASSAACYFHYTPIQWYDTAKLRRSPLIRLETIHLSTESLPHSFNSYHITYGFKSHILCIWKSKNYDGQKVIYVHIIPNHSPIRNQLHLMFALKIKFTGNLINITIPYIIVQSCINVAVRCLVHNEFIERQIDR